MSSPKITVENLSIGYEDYAVMNNLNFEVGNGEIFVVMGASGCGKSTLLRTMIGLQDALSGSISYGGKNFNNAPEDEKSEMLRSFGVLYQGGALWSAMTLEENIALPLRSFTKFSESDIKELVNLKLALVGNLGLIAPVREAGMRVHGDFGLNIFNSASMNVMRSLEMASATVSFEMTLPQIRDMSKAVNAELIAYGRLPLMVTEHCLIHNKTNECTCHLKATRLIDKTGAEFPVIRDGDSCRSVLLNGKKLSLLDRQADLARLGLWAVRLSFTTENPREVDQVLAQFREPTPFDPGSCTRGLYLRGVE